MEKQMQLGMEMKDKVSGFKGIAVAKVEYLNGCVQFCLQPKIKKNGEHPEGHYFDKEQLEIIGQGVNMNKKETGGEMTNVPPTSYR